MDLDPNVKFQSNIAIFHISPKGKLQQEEYRTWNIIHYSWASRPVDLLFTLSHLCTICFTPDPDYTTYKCTHYHHCGASSGARSGTCYVSGWTPPPMMWISSSWEHWCSPSCSSCCPPLSCTTSYLPLWVYSVHTLLYNLLHIMFHIMLHISLLLTIILHIMLHIITLHLVL